MTDTQRLEKRSVVLVFMSAGTLSSDSAIKPGECELWSRSKVGSPDHWLQLKVISCLSLLRLNRGYCVTPPADANEFQHLGQAHSNIFLYFLLIPAKNETMIPHNGMTDKENWNHEWKSVSRLTVKQQCFGWINPVCSTLQ